MVFLPQSGEKFLQAEGVFFMKGQGKKVGNGSFGKTAARTHVFNRIGDERGGKRM